ncbi:MAG: hypothetical protein M3Y77_09960 [Actinomycetota bacterium]|nr:hypothetical protein [Actinomycetota bacterium]MDQ2846654.1 hypothetical protein [Actinomycetota bacterium]
MSGGEQGEQGERNLAGFTDGLALGADRLLTVLDQPLVPVESLDAGRAARCGCAARYRLRRAGDRGWAARLRVG